MFMHQLTIFLFYIFNYNPKINSFLYQINKQKEKIKMSNPMNKKMFFIDETETEESTYNFAAQLPNSYGSKKSITSFPSKIFLDDSKNNIPKRKYTLEPSLCIKDFVPHPKPLEIHFVPSKLRLNTKGFKDFKINQSNQILLDSNKYYISCPESENSDSSDSDEYINLKSKNTMKDMRKNMMIEKKNIPKVLSKEIMHKKGLKINDEERSYDESDLYSNEDDNYDDFVLSGMNDNDHPKEVREKRLNSCSILQILESNSKI